VLLLRLVSVAVKVMVPLTGGTLGLAVAPGFEPVAMAVKVALVVAVVSVTDGGLNCEIPAGNAVLGGGLTMTLPLKPPPYVTCTVMVVL